MWRVATPFYLLPAVHVYSFCAFYCTLSFVLHVRIDVKRRCDIRVPHDLLDGLGIDAQPEQVCAKRMPEDVGATSGNETSTSMFKSARAIKLCSAWIADGLSGIVRYPAVVLGVWTYDR